MSSELFILWFLVTASDAIGAMLAAFSFYRLRTRFSFYLALFMVTVAVEAFIAAASLLIFWPNEVEVAPVFALTRSAGRMVKNIGVWALALYLLNICGKAKREEEAG